MAEFIYQMYKVRKAHGDKVILVKTLVSQGVVSHVIKKK